MSSSVISTFTFASKQVSIYMGIPILVTGVIGGLLNIIVFCSLRTFRQSSCAFYLTIMSIVNIIQLITGLFSYMLTNGFDVNWTQTSLFYCKFRIYFIQVSLLLSFTCYCLATIDQYFATCSRPQWQQWCHIKIAWRLCVISAIVWLLYGIPYLIFYNLVVSSTTGSSSCLMTNTSFNQYFKYFHALILTCFAPVFISVSFGLLAYRNVRQISYGTVPLVRRELDKQLTKMVLFQVLINFFVIVPQMIMIILQLLIPIINDNIITAQIRFVSSIALYIYYSYYATSFYIYICVSERFRRQLVYVLSRMYHNRWRRPTIVVNQVAPEM